MKARLYIDGFNFYYAIEKNLPKHLIYLGWCDFSELAKQHLLPRGCELVEIKYFTAPVGEFGFGDERKWQDIWLQAVKTIDILKVIPGFHKPDELKKRKEKQTDVNIAVEMILDAFLDDFFDLSVLISADEDLIPAVDAVTSRVAKPRNVEVWFPPGIISEKWLKRQDENIHCNVITQDMLEKSQFPDKIEKVDRIIQRPRRWKKREK